MNALVCVAYGTERIALCVWVFCHAAVEETDVLGSLPDIGTSVVTKSARLKRRRSTMVERGGRSAKPSTPSKDLERSMEPRGFVVHGSLSLCKCLYICSHSREGKNTECRCFCLIVVVVVVATVAVTEWILMYWSRNRQPMGEIYNYIMCQRVQFCL